MLVFCNKYQNMSSYVISFGPIEGIGCKGTQILARMQIFEGFFLLDGILFRDY